MSNNLFGGPPVDLPQMLEARERRSQRQAQLLAHDAATVLVAMTLNTPGPVKYSETLARVGHQVAQEVTACLRHVGPVRHQEMVEAVTGVEYYWLVDQEPALIKRALVDLEASHPLGRLLDLDVVQVIQGQPQPMSRTALGLAPRTCFLCQQEAKLCARSRRHTVAEMQAFISQAVADYEART